MAASTMRSDAWANGLPENCVEVFAENRHGAECRNRNQGREHCVLEQVLPVMLFQQSL
jgi:hypothetical protein